MHNTSEQKHLDDIFEAFGNQHRRDIVYALGLQPHAISHLAEMLQLSLPAIHKHIRILKQAQLIKTKKIGRTTVLIINRKSLQTMQSWLMQFQAYWGNDQETLENYAQYVTGKLPRGGEKKK